MSGLKSIDNADIRKGVGRILSPLLAEAQLHPALWEKINQALEALPEDKSTLAQDRATTGAIVAWMQMHRPEV